MKPINYIAIVLVLGVIAYNVFLIDDLEKEPTKTENVRQITDNRFHHFSTDSSGRVVIASGDTLAAIKELLFIDWSNVKDFIAAREKAVASMYRIGNLQQAYLSRDSISPYKSLFNASEMQGIWVIPAQDTSEQELSFIYSDVDTQLVQVTYNVGTDRFSLVPGGVSYSISPRTPDGSIYAIAKKNDVQKNSVKILGLVDSLTDGRRVYKDLNGTLTFIKL